MLPALGLFRPKGRDLQGRGTFLITGFLIPSDWNVIASLAFLLSYGAHHPPTFQVMRRRLQTIRLHTDCTCRDIFGRWNRYSLAIHTLLGMLDVKDSISYHFTFFGFNGRAFHFFKAILKNLGPRLQTQYIPERPLQTNCAK